jgi:thiol-disulfide isomerase/thioredoxin
MSTLKSMHVFYAGWCPHCVPTTVEPVRKKAEQIAVPCVIYAVDDPKASRKADELAKKYGTGARTT